VNPVVALTLGILVGDDMLSGRVLLSAVFVIGAVALTISGAPAAKTDRASEPERSLPEEDRLRARAS
jgi:hypothetical protein